MASLRAGELPRDNGASDMTLLAESESVPAVDRSESELVALARALSFPECVDSWSEDAWRSRHRLAIEQRVGPLLYRSLSDRGSLGREPGLSALRKAYYQSAAENLVRLQELNRLIGSDVVNDVVVVKGGALAMDLYENPALRPMSDLDLLVREEAFETWQARLIELGYRTVVPEMASGLEESTRFQVSMVGGPAKSVLVELHRSLVAGQRDSRAPDLGWVWAHTEPMHGGARRLDPTANLIYLAAHAMLQHRGAEMRLLWLVDIDRLVRRFGAEIDWDDAAAASGRFGWTNALDSALERCRAWFDTPIPAHRSAVGSSPAATTPGSPDPVEEVSRGERVWGELGCLDWRARARLALALAFPSPAYVRWRYPQFGSRWPLGYVYRWWRILVEAGVAVLGRWRRGR